MGEIEHQIDSYLEWCEFVKRMTPATMVTKRKALQRFMAVNSSLTDFSELTNWQFDDWRASLAKEGKAGKTINNYADHITSCIRYLKVHRKLKVEFDLEAVVRAEEDQPEIIIYTEEEIAKTLEHCRGPRDTLIISLAYQSGLRLQEIASLKVENIEGLALKVTGKKRKRRTTFIREDTRRKLDKWLVLNEITIGYVFPSPVKYGAHMTSQNVRDIIKHAFKRAGIEKRVHPHAIRHTWFTMMLDSGAPLMDTSIMGGHTDPKTTKRYYHASPKRHKAIHEAFIPTADKLGTDRQVVHRPKDL